MPIPENLSRRGFCALGVSALSSLALGRPHASGANIPVALQLFSVRRDCAANLPLVLNQLAGFGCQGVEFAGFYGHTAQDIRHMLDDASLRCCGSHTPLEQLTAEKLEATVEFNAEIGNHTLIVPGLPATYRSSQDWRSAARLFNSLAARLAKAGMRIGYHNHAVEFKKEPDGKLPWDILFGNTKHEVTIQLDVGNARLAGVDANALLRRYPGRTKSIHVKDCLPGQPDVMLGTSDFDWTSFLRLCRSVAGTEWYIIEHESHDIPAMDAARESLRRFRQILAEDQKA